MSRCWDLNMKPLPNDNTAVVEAIDLDDEIRLVLEYVDEGMASMLLPEPSVRELRDWLSWWLDEGPEPGA